jgi:hypothetical protein
VKASWAYALLVGVLVLSPTRASAGHPGVAKARLAYDELRFADVLLEVAMTRREGPLSRADEIELTRLEAYTYAVFEDEERALTAFRRLLALEPGFVPRDASPKIRDYLDRARRRPARAGAPVQLTTTPGAPPRRTASSRSLFASPWFWGGVAVVLVSGTGLALLLARDGTGSQPGNLGTLELP